VIAQRLHGAAAAGAPIGVPGLLGDPVDYGAGTGRLQILGIHRFP